MSTDHTHGAQGAPSPGQPASQPGDFFMWIRGLGVSRGPDRWAGGVASGLAHRWGVEPILIRGLFVVASIFLGVGLLVYGVLWLVLPEPDGRIHLQQAMHGHWTAGMTGALVAAVLGLGGARTGLPVDTGSNAPFWGTIWAIFWLAVAALIVVSIVRSRRTHHPGAVPYAAGPPAAGTVGMEPPPLYPPQTLYGEPPAQPAPPPPAPAPVPPRTYRRGPGGPFTTVVVGLAVIVGGALLAFQLSGAALVDPSSGAVWAIAAAIVGLGIIVAGARGRSGGILSFFAVAALAAAVLTQPAYQFSQSPGMVDFSPTTVSQARAGYSITGSSGQLDLRGLDGGGPLSADAVIPVDATMSQLKVTVPKGLPVRVEADATMSNVHFGSKSMAGITAQGSQTYNADRQGSTLVVHLHATMSNVEIQQEQ
ncbi:PspC domain-containing protein [Sinomonas atrocyanea]|uniref:PspC domain-containing protein n=1 Tax=Sinomonas atrocyanea TaxID=37927 RepID=UPI0028643F89|nr:PspC domain-containing protein [Sinomonas atrocyanea]MDR6620999.1 phage shock protein PspC (stress-responsive transcriptional regulator) [Sinomonas atrocyanea]